jgi:uncharacterized protein YjgD (DUF1641 family)
MSALDDDSAEDEGVPPAVEDAIAANADAVAALLDRSGQLGELLDALSLLEDGLDDEMVATVTGDATTLGLAASELAEPETVAVSAAVGQNGDELATTIDRLATLQHTGTLDSLLEVADALALATDAADDDMLTTLAATGTSLGTVAAATADDDVRDGLLDVIEGVGRANAADAAPVGAVGLLQALRDPEVQAGLGYLVAVARGIGAANRPMTDNS